MNGSALFEAFYSRLILRDVFGKIVPGCIVLSAVVAASRGGAVLVSSANSLSVGVWIVVLGVAWITGFAVQGAGEAFEWFKYDPPEARLTSPQRNALRLALRFKEDHGHELNRQNLERLIVIREACGNGYIAVMLSAGILLWDWSFRTGFARASVSTVLPELLRQLPAAVLIIGTIICLRKMHFAHVARFYVHAIRLLKHELKAAEFADFKDDLDDAIICKPHLPLFTGGLILGYAGVVTLGLRFGLWATTIR